jgi:hypothetical protein
MPIIKMTKSPNGVNIGYHKVIKVELSGDFSELKISLEGYGSEEIALSGQPLAWFWNVTMNAAALSALTIEAIESALVTAPESVFYGGMVVVPQSSIDALKARVWAQIKHSRQVAEDSGFSYMGMDFDSDPLSQQRIRGAIQLAQDAMSSNQPFETEWTLKDNNTVRLTGAQLIGAGAALSRHLGECHARSRKLRAHLAGLTNEADVIATHY